ncbi:ATP-binding cassette domain-containing protein [Streptomyces sp. NPDC004284]|uniref:ATP-binding cassette domain-containing protein n=1 Tax=Streptomyces sp. NPDC004284 TaxID=3364695 RepID=UPI0036C1464D
MFSTLLAALAVVRRTWRPHAVYGLAACVTTATALALPVLLARGVDAAVRGGRVGSEALWFAAAVALNLLGTTVASRAKSGAVAAAGARLRHGLVRHVLAVGLPATRAFHPGDLLARLTGGVSVAADIGFAAVNCAAAVVGALGALIALAVISPAAAAVFAAGVGATALVLRSGVRRALAAYGRYQTAQARITGDLGEALGGAGTVRAAGSLDREVRRITGALPDLAAAGREDWTNNGRTGARLALLTGAAELGVLGLCGWSVAYGHLAPGMLLAAMGYVVLGAQNVEQLTGLTHFAQMVKSVERVDEVCALPLPEPSPAPAGRGGDGGGIRLSGVGVVRDGVRLLRGCDLHVPAGRELAVVGGSGAGKSTLAFLVGGLIAPDEGSVTLDGAPLVSGRATAARVGYAFERPVLVGGTLREALCQGRPEATGEELRAACDAARIAAFVERLPRGYETPLAELVCSGGEAQRLGIARVLLQNPSVMVLDDATSSLDTATEAEVTAAIRAAAARATRVVVAHRPGTAARADLVAWLEDGRVRAVAPHRELWSDPAYRAVFAPPAPPAPVSSSPVLSPAPSSALPSGPSPLAEQPQEAAS